MNTWHRRAALLLALSMALGMGAGAVSAPADGESTALAAEAGQAQDAAEAAQEQAAAEAGQAEAAQAGQEQEAAETGQAEAAEAGQEQEAAEAGQEEAAEPDPAGTLSFANIGARMRQHYYPMYILQESIDDINSHDYAWRQEYMRERVNEAATAGFGLAMVGMGSLMQSSYDAALKSFNDLRYGTTAQNDAEALRQYENAQNQLVVMGESLFMTMKDLEAQDGALARTITTLERTAEELRLRAKLGQVPELTVSQAENGLVQAQSGQQTLRMNTDVALLNLESMVGAELGEALRLGELPKVTEEQLAAMELEPDLARAKELSYTIFDAEKQIRDFQAGNYIDVILQFGENEKVFEVSQVKHALRSLEFQRDNTALNFELNFRALFAQVKDCAQVLEAKRAALSAQEKSYAADALRFKQGSLAENKLADAKDELAQAKDDVAAAERALFGKYRAYEWAVQYGILNSGSQGGSSDASN